MAIRPLKRSVEYCIIYEVIEEDMGLVSLWHGVGARNFLTLIRLNALYLTKF